MGWARSRIACGGRIAKRIGCRRYCYPLTITDFASRYLLSCEALLTTQEQFAFTVFERTFKEFGMPAVANVLQQQARFDTWVVQYNQERPHEALGMKVPADLYTRSPRVYRGLNDLTYPFHDQTIAVTHCGRICFKGRKVNLSHVFAGQSVGITQVSERIWLATFNPARI